MTGTAEEWSEQKYFATLFLFYFIAHGGILFIPNAIYWDDWILYQANPKIILDIFQQTGSIFNLSGYTHNFFLSIGPWFYKILTFILMFGAGVSLDKILRKHDFFTPEARFLIVLFFLVLPFYWARVGLVNMVSTISYFLFFFAWTLMDCYRVLALFLFLLSFNANSLLVFYILPFLDYYYRLVGERISIKSLIIFSVHKFDFLLLPFIFFIFKIFFYTPSGLYEGYNEQYNFLGVFNTIKLMFLDLASFFLKLTVLDSHFITFLLVLALFFGILIFFSSFSEKRTWRNPSIILAMGSFAFVFGGLPYWLLGYTPSLLEWTSRHSILLPLGSSLILLAFLGMINIKLRPVLLSVILTFSIISNLDTYKDFYFDWRKQVALIGLMAENELIRNADLVVFDDGAYSLNAINRTYRSYEWNGLLKNSFGDESRYGINQRELKDFKSSRKSDHVNGKYHNYADFDTSHSLETVLVKISTSAGRFESLRNDEPLVSVDVIKLPQTVLKE